MKFLQRVTTKGVPINNIVFFKPSVTLCPNACGYGIGGYSENGLAWRWIIPEARHGKLTLNLLEFLASALTIYMTILKMVQGSHILAFKDSSSALGWMYKAYFDPVNKESHDVVAFWIGWKLVSNKTSLYSKHIKGTENIIADQKLTKLLNKILPQQTAASFHIKQPPSNIISWISSLAEASTLPTASPNPLQPSILETGIGG